MEDDDDLASKHPSLHARRKSARGFMDRSQLPDVTQHLNQ
jgi:hypothetical protein